MTMRALLILLLLLLVQSGLLAFVFGVGDFEPGYVTLSGTIKASPPSR
jgi:hypothetical protein